MFRENRSNVATPQHLLGLTSCISLHVSDFVDLHCCSPPHSFADLANCYSFPGFHRQVRAPRKSAESPAAILLDCQVRM